MLKNGRTFVHERTGPILALVGLLALCGCSGSTGAAVAEPQGDKQGEGAKKDSEPKVLVRLGDFRRGTIEARLPVSADLEAVDEADVYSESSGIIREIRCREGAKVNRGDPVVLLDDEQLRLVRENRRIIRDQAQTKLNQAKLAPREAQAQLEQKKLLLEQAEAEYGRALKSNEDGILSPEETEKKRYEREQARIDAATAALQVEKVTLAEKEAEQALRLAEVELETAEYNLSRAQVRSPIDGHISYLDVKPGEFVRANSGAVNVPAPVFSVVNLEKLEARVYVPQRELRRLKAKQKVRITCEVYPGEEFWGEVEVINPVIDKDIRTVRVIVGVELEAEHVTRPGGRDAEEDPTPLLKPGMFINAEIILDTHQDAWLVPKRAIVYENQEPVLFLAHDGVARRYVVTKGYSSQEEIEALKLTDVEGNEVEPGSGRLVLVGQNKLKNGSPVEIE